MNVFPSVLDSRVWCTLELPDFLLKCSVLRLALSLVILSDTGNESTESFKKNTIVAGV
jgi:hypothetical protein